MTFSDANLRIRAVVEQTGIPRNTIVAWERRYGLVKPVRLENGYRLYSEADVDRLQRAKALVDQGHAISQVAKLLDAEGSGVVGTGLDAVRTALRDALLAYDGAGADQHAQRLVLTPFEDVLVHVVEPLLVEVGTLWESGAIGVAQEHYASAWCRTQVLGMLRRIGTGAPGATRIVCAGFPGEDHEIGLLSVALRLALRGYGVTVLGNEVPPHELGAAVLSTRAQVACQSLVIERPLAELRAHVKACRALLPPEVPLALGGPGIAQVGAAEISGAWVVHSVDDLVARLG